MASLLGNLQSIAEQQLQLLWQKAEPLLHPLLENDQWKPYAITLGVLGPLSYIFYKNYIDNLYLNPLNRLPGPPIGWDALFMLGNFREITVAEVGKGCMGKLFFFLNTPQN
jgi:hypothetical protein